jgi:hypothetical protein
MKHRWTDGKADMYFCSYVIQIEDLLHCDIRKIIIYNSKLPPWSSCCFNHNHTILLQDVEILSTKSGYLDHLIMEAIEVDLHPNNINREDGLILSGAWKPIIRLLKENSNSPSLPLSHTQWILLYLFLEFGSPPSRHGHFFLCGYSHQPYIYICIYIYMYIYIYIYIHIPPPLFTHCHPPSPCQNLS